MGTTTFGFSIKSEFKRVQIFDEAFVGRTGFAGDLIGSRVLASLQIDRIIDIAFMQERKYIPYRKWEGTAFRKLASSRQLLPIFEKTLDSKTWKTRDLNISKAYEVIAKKHNQLKITKKVNDKCLNFHTRPYKIISTEAIGRLLLETIKSFGAMMIITLWLG